MRVRIIVDKEYSEPELLIKTADITEEIKSLADRLSHGEERLITGKRNDKIKILEKNDIIRIYRGNGKTFALTEDGEYQIKLKMYECEEYLSENRFVRISNSEIINLKKAESFDLSFAGTICVKLTDGTSTYVSRRYIPKIRKKLGM